MVSGPWPSTHASMQTSKSNSVGKSSKGSERERIRELRDGAELGQNTFYTYMKLSKGKLIKRKGGACKDGHLGPACAPGNSRTGGGREGGTKGRADLHPSASEGGGGVVQY